MDENIQKLGRWIRESRRMVFFGGAGVSTESGIPDFRGESGIYRRQYPYPAETMLSRGFFEQNPAEFFDFYRAVMLRPKARPNAAHRVLARLEREGILAACITQNIDGLHQAAGSQNVLELHGSVLRNDCLRCGRRWGLDAVLGGEGPPRCAACGGPLKPDVVLYGESLDNGTLDRAVAAIRRADLLLVGGTSLAVYPAAGLIDYYTGPRLALVNLHPTPRDDRAALLLRGKIGEVLAAACPWALDAPQDL